MFTAPYGVFAHRRSLRPRPIVRSLCRCLLKSFGLMRRIEWWYRRAVLASFPAANGSRNANEFSLVWPLSWWGMWLSWKNEQVNGKTFLISKDDPHRIDKLRLYMVMEFSRLDVATVDWLWEGNPMWAILFENKTRMSSLFYLMMTSVAHTVVSDCRALVARYLYPRTRFDYRKKNSYC